MGTLMENVVLFSKKMLQKLYDGTLIIDSQTLLDFLGDQIVVVRQTQRHLNMQIYTCQTHICIKQKYLFTFRHVQTCII